MNYYTLGKTGLKVSPLALGTMTFGIEWGWGADEKGAREMFDMARERGVNFFDTADQYTGGTSEEYLGKFVKDSGLRDQSVIATKYTLNDQADPNTGGNSRKNMIASVEGSLRRMGTDYIDLLYLHCWDRVTPPEEVMRAFDDLVRAGKIRYAGLSDVPAWYAARAQSVAEFRGYEPLAAIQLEYSLVERNIEFEFIDLGAALGPGLVAWSPLGGGLLSGKYKPSERQDEDKGRLAIMQDSINPAFAKFNDRNWAIVVELEKVAKEIGRSMASTALNWLVNRPGVGSVLVGASRPEQLKDNFSALDFEIPAELMDRLTKASEPESHFPYTFFEPEIQGLITGGAVVGDKPETYVKQVLNEGEPATITTDDSEEAA
jgi:aryl-alcohol dehydrogenase-like predicted oxidoreductase